jgi:hypothetical protein
MKTTLIAALTIILTSITMSTEASHPRHGYRAPVYHPRVVIVPPQPQPIYCTPRPTYQVHRGNPNYNQLLRMAYADGVITPRERMILEQNRPRRNNNNCR